MSIFIYILSDTFYIIRTNPNLRKIVTILFIFVYIQTFTSHRNKQTTHGEGLFSIQWSGGNSEFQTCSAARSPTRVALRWRTRLVMMSAKSCGWIPDGRAIKRWGRTDGWRSRVSREGPRGRLTSCTASLPHLPAWLPVVAWLLLHFYCALHRNQMSVHLAC